MPLSNITGDFPCLNVHPGDLTVERDGQRVFVGLHAIPTELAIINNFKTIRSSVIIAQPYTGQGGEMDSGPILGISPELELGLQAFTYAELLDIYNKRPAKKPSRRLERRFEQNSFRQSGAPERKRRLDSFASSRQRFRRRKIRNRK